MANKINLVIRDNYLKYQSLVKGGKNLPCQTITLCDVKGRHPNTWINTTPAEHEELDEKLELIVESKILDKRSFKFQIRAPEFTGEPLFRFDSDGPSHFNRNPHLPLPELKVDTPHFNAFDERGKSIAYKSEALQKPENTLALLNDVSLCMAHYCDEANIYCNKKYIEISLAQDGRLNLPFEDENPLDGVVYE